MKAIYECVCCGLTTKTNLYPIGSGAFMEFCAPCAEAWLARQEGKGAECRHGGEAL